MKIVEHRKTTAICTLLKKNALQITNIQSQTNKQEKNVVQTFDKLAAHALRARMKNK